MIAALSLPAWPAMGRIVGDHLWQSTLVAGAAGLLALALRRNRAHVRHWLWLAASIKFLVPFAALVALGSQFAWRTISLTQPGVTFVVNTMMQPFSGSELGPVGALPPTASANAASVSPFLLLAIWFVGTAAILLSWWTKWRRVAQAVRLGSSIDAGRELEMLRCLENIGGIKKPIVLVMSDEPIEPGVFGIFKPALLWPRGIGDHLNDRQLEAILAHEVCHVRRRDNIAASVHMLVEAVFWFHPLVWWLGARLVDERERACDEEVIRLGSEPQLYAESILKTCRLFVESPLACVSGVTGSNLKRRVEEIMRRDDRRSLNVSRKLLLASIAGLTLAAPVAVGLLNAGGTLDRAQSVAPAAPVGTAKFDVAAIKRNTSEGPMRMQVQPGGRMTMTNAPVRQMLRTAYRLQDFQIVGGPSWLESDRFDIVAKAEGNPNAD